MSSEPTWNPVTGCTPASGSPRLGNTESEWAFWWFIRWGLRNARELKAIFPSASWYECLRLEWLAGCAWAEIHLRHREYPNRHDGKTMWVLPGNCGWQTSCGDSCMRYVEGFIVLCVLAVVVIIFGIVAHGQEQKGRQEWQGSGRS